MQVPGVASENEDGIVRSEIAAGLIWLESVLDRWEVVPLVKVARPRGTFQFDLLCANTGL